MEVLPTLRWIGVVRARGIALFAINPCLYGVCLLHGGTGTAGTGQPAGGNGERVSLTRGVGDSGQSTSRLCHFRLIPVLRLISILLRRA
jgi:hypothetical protein